MFNLIDSGPSNLQYEPLFPQTLPPLCVNLTAYNVSLVKLSTCNKLRQAKPCHSITKKALIIAIIGAFSFNLQPAFAQTASWYSRESCIKESGQAVMANGKELSDNEYTCASWDYKFGVLLKITNIDNKKSVVVMVSDRGPSKRLYRLGRTIDLSKRAFSKIANLREGIIEVSIEEAR